jgi:hypothetical protein
LLCTRSVGIFVVHPAAVNNAWTGARQDSERPSDDPTASRSVRKERLMNVGYAGCFHVTVENKIPA